MRPVSRLLRRVFRKTTLLLAVASLFFATSRLAQAANGNPSPPRFRIVDRHGKLVGYPLTENVVARQINGVWVTLYVNPGTGIFDSGAIYVHYTTPDCTGTPYVAHYSNFSEGTRVGSTLYYPVDALELTPNSVRVAYSDGAVGTCTPAQNLVGIYGIATTVEVDSFGLETPFRVVE